MHWNLATLYSVLWVDGEMRSLWAGLGGSLVAFAASPKYFGSNGLVHLREFENLRVKNAKTDN